MQKTDFSAVQSKKILSISFYFFCCFITVLFSKETVCYLLLPWVSHRRLSCWQHILATATKETVQICFAFCLWGKKKLKSYFPAFMSTVNSAEFDGTMKVSKSSWILAACTWEWSHLGHLAPQTPFGFNSSLTRFSKWSCSLKKRLDKPFVH